MTASRFSPASTALYAGLWLAVVLQGWLPLIEGGAAVWLQYPADSAARQTGRDVELAEAGERIGGLGGRVVRVLHGSPDEALEGAEATLEQVLDSPDATGPAADATRARLAVLAAERAGRAADLPDGSELEGWYRDAWERQRARAEGDASRAAFHDARIADRGARLRQRSLALTAASFGVVVLGVLVLATRPRALAGLLRGGPRGPAWSLADGVGVFVRGDFWNRLYFVTLAWLWTQPLGRALAASPAGALLDGWGTLVASLPMLWLVHRHLLAPHALAWTRAFGLRPGLAAAVSVGVCAVALDLLGTHALSWTAWGLGIESSWAEGFDELLVWGTRADVLLAAGDYVVWTPALEELAFRGVLYYSLRHRLGPLPAALASAALFAGLHFYSLPGLLMTGWSGLVWALAFERLQSLTPGIAAHAVYNGLYLAGVLLLYR